MSKMQGKATKMMAASAMDRKGPSNKNLAMGASAKPKPSVPMSGALKGPKKSQGM